MSNNISLNDAKNGAFLASQAYKNVVNKVKNAKEQFLIGSILKNDTTNSSFEVVEQKNEYTAFEKGFGFSTTVFRNINTIMQKCML